MTDATQNTASTSNVVTEMEKLPSSTSKALTETGTLPIGIVIDGVRHQDFELRLPTIGDQVDASQDVTTNSGLEIQAAIYARQLVRLGTLQPDRIDLDLMLNLNPLDFNAIDTADDELRKKAMREGQGLSGGTNFAHS